MELSAWIEASTEQTRAALASALGVVGDPASRLGPVEQLVRAWFRRPANDRSFDAEQRHVLRLLLDTPEGMPVDALPATAADLIAKGWLFLDASGRVHMPDALRLCLSRTASDAPHAARLLLVGLPPEEARALSATHYGRPVQGPVHAALERPLRRLMDAAWVEGAIAGLQAPARRLLDAAKQRAGELGTAEILELEREPARILVGGAAVVPRRSQAYALARLGLMLPQPGRAWCVPEEVWRVLTAADRREYACRLGDLSARDDEDEPLPARVDRALSPGACAAVLLATLNERGALREGVGVSRSAAERAARDVGVPGHAAAALIAVGRAAGLPFGEAALGSLAETLWHAWRVTAAWNELDDEPDVLRHSSPRETPDAVLRAAREAVLETLARLPPHRFATRTEVLHTALASARVGQARAELVARILDVTLPALGFIDTGKLDGAPVMRATAPARAFLAGEALPLAAAPPRPHPPLDAPIALRRDATLTQLRVLSRVGRLWVDGLNVVAELDPVALGLEASEVGWGALERSLGDVLLLDSEERVAELHALAVRTEAVCWQSLQAALHIPDSDLRARLLRSPEASDLCVPLQDDSEYLFVRAGVSATRVRRWLRGHGVRLTGH